MMALFSLSPHPFISRDTQTAESWALWSFPQAGPPHWICFWMPLISCHPTLTIVFPCKDWVGLCEWSLGCHPGKTANASMVAGRPSHLSEMSLFIPSTWEIQPLRKMLLGFFRLIYNQLFKHRSCTHTKSETKWWDPCLVYMTEHILKKFLNSSQITLKLTPPIFQPSLVGLA